ncbi:MAG: DUF3267 domain-containing protein [Thermoanaerobaculia bacterium]
MKFVTGPIPEDPSFDPEGTGWRKLREPHPARINLLAIPIAAVVLGVLFLFIRSYTPIAMKDIGSRFLLAFLIIIPLHEGVHALLTPRFGTTRETLVGCWPSHMLFYAHYDGELPRERFLAVLLAPFVIITVIPLSVIALLQLNAPWVAAMAFANGLGAAGDLIGVFIVLTQVPRQAIVRNKGWRTYWRREPLLKGTNRTGERASRPQ